MGTNFYFEPDRGGAHFHIGKRSAGWKFTVRAWDEYGIHSYRDLIQFLEVTPGAIWDEYGEQYAPVFWAMHETERSRDQVRTEDRVPEQGPKVSRNFLVMDEDITVDDEGHTVMNCNFC